MCAQPGLGGEEEVRQSGRLDHAMILEGCSRFNDLERVYQYGTCDFYQVTGK